MSFKKIYKENWKEIIDNSTYPTNGSLYIGYDNSGQVLNGSGPFDSDTLLQMDENGNVTAIGSGTTIGTGSAGTSGSSAVGSSGSSGYDGIHGASSRVWVRSIDSTPDDNGELYMLTSSLASLTYIRLYESDLSGTDVSNWIYSWDDTDNNGIIKLTKETDNSVFGLYQITSISDNGGYAQVDFSLLSANGSISRRLSEYTGAPITNS